MKRYGMFAFYVVMIALWTGWLMRDNAAFVRVFDGVLLWVNIVWLLQEIDRLRNGERA